MNIIERRNALVVRRELSAAQRRASAKNRLFVSLGNFKSFFEEV